MIELISWSTSLASGTSLRGYFEPPYTFEETVARLVALSGQSPADRSDGYKTSVEFVGHFKGQVFTLYDYKGDRSLHVGGTSALDVDGLRQALIVELATIAPVAYSAIEYYECAGRRHGWES